jgi:hypothetical protein
VLAGEVAHVLLRGEAPELPDAATVDRSRLPECVRLLERGQVGELVVDGLQLERVLVPREMQVVLLVEGRDEAVCALAERVELARGLRGARHRRRILACRPST